jgi:hypothetical protein
VKRVAWLAAYITIVDGAGTSLCAACHGWWNFLDVKWLEGGTYRKAKTFWVSLWNFV